MEETWVQYTGGGSALGRQGNKKTTKQQNKLCKYSYSLQAETFEYCQWPIKLMHSFVFIPFLLFVSFLLVSV